MPNEDTSSNSRSNAYLKLVKTRKYLRQRVTRIHNILNYSPDAVTAMDKSTYLDTLKVIKVELMSCDRDIHSHLVDDEATAIAEIEEQEQYELKIAESLNILEGNRISNVPHVSSAPVLGSQNKLKLPDVALPIFSNDKKDSLERFLYSFESIVDKHVLSSYEKFIYLKGQLRGSPRTLVESLSTNEQNYDKAKDLLTEAFASKVTQKFDVVERLAGLKLDIGTDPYEFIGDMRSIIASFENLNIDIDDILQYFIWSALNDRFQSQLVQITNKTKPTLQEIKTHIFSATERYIKITDRINENKFKYKDKGNWSQNRVETGKTTSFAVNVKAKSFIPCWLCIHDGMNNVDHIMKDCIKYVSPTDKVNKLKSLKYCSYCSFKNHSTDKCRFKFSSKCRNCDGNHLSWLCTKVVSQNVQNKLSIVQTLSVDCSYDQVLLPSFTCDVKNNDTCLNIRILKDSGTQRNFITEHVAIELGLESVKENVKLSINGFNSVRNIMTRIVNVPLRVNDHVYVLESVVVPSLDISLTVPDLEVLVEGFKSKGYQLGDAMLQDCCIDNFSMIVGSDIDPILIPSTLVFGEAEKCSVQQTTVGILLNGKLEVLMKNLKNLPVVSSSSMIYSSESSDCGSYSMKVAVSDVLDSRGMVQERKLETASEENLERAVNDIMNYDNLPVDDEIEVNKDIAEYILSNSDRDVDGRLRMPLPWNPSTKHLLSTNLSLSKKILMTNLKKLRNSQKLASYDQVFREQEESGVIERVGDIDKFLATNPGSSILPHMGVYRTVSETTKVRVVYLSNLCEKTNLQPNGVSHNVALLPGPCVNSKLITNMILSRFGRYLLLFDIVKAFLQISLNEYDQNRLLFLWFNNVDKDDFSLVAYRCKRLPFGLRPSPAILMLSLYKLLILDIDNDTPDVVDLKKLIYSSMYVDNGSVSSESAEYIDWAYSKLESIFGAYQFQLQQFATNESILQSKIDEQCELPSDDIVKHFGMQWKMSADTISPYPINLNIAANTCRKILASLHSVYDPFGIYCPIMNRAKLFYQRLQGDNSLSWDTKVSDEHCREWKKICQQANLTPAVELPRYIGPREGEYDIIAFCDASGSIYGTVVYLVEVDLGKVSFLLAKSRVVGSSHSNKTIPSLELQGICYATEVLVGLYDELAGPNVVLPINVRNFIVYTDSMVCLAWIKSYFVSHTKMQKKSVFVQNRLKQISELCKSFPVTYRYIEGKSNPADYTTRNISYNILKKTDYLSGPSFLVGDCIPNQPDIEVTVPYISEKPCSQSTDDSCLVLKTQANSEAHYTVEPERHSRLSKLLKVYVHVLRFVRCLKERIKDTTTPNDKVRKIEEVAFDRLITEDQAKYFPGVTDYFSKREVAVKDVPSIVLQLNLFIDSDHIIRVKSKFKLTANCPILMHPDSHVTKLLINDYHIANSHAGLFITLKEIRRKFWILKGFSSVKKELKKCITCRKINERPINVNQNAYRNFRESPPQIPFRSVFLDYMGPFHTRFEDSKRKCWLLIICCIWSRAINIEVCLTADVNDFLRALQSHIYKYGMFQLCISDLGSQIVAGSKVVRNYLDDHVTREYLAKHGIMNVQFDNYPKGDSSLGGIIEICVKQSKSLINKTISKGMLELEDFTLLITKVIHIINRRPIAFQESLRESQQQLDFPDPITPEQLLRGYDVVSVDIIPQLDQDNTDPSYIPGGCPDRTTTIKENFNQLHEASERLREVYHREYLQTLFCQGMDVRDRYKPVLHKKLKVGDIVLLVEENCKQINYPMGIVASVTENDLGEVTAAEVFKGKTKEKVFRSVKSLILLLPSFSELEDNESVKDPSSETLPKPKKSSETICYQMAAKA